MQTVMMIFFVALAVTVVSTPALRRFALWIGFLDIPAERKSHRSPVPLLGGVAILAGAVAALLISLPTLTISSRVIGVSLAVLIVAGTGLFDDRRDLSAWVKFGGQSLATLILILFDVRVSLPLPETVNLLLTFSWVICISNAVNFLDNMDGLCTGVSAVAAAFFVLISAMHGQILVAALAASVFGACLGFLPYNFKPAVIFMGDAGSLFLGFLLAVIGILLRFPDNINIVTWMVPVLILGLPILDMVLVLLSRTFRGINPFTAAGKDHLSHRLVILGFQEREAVLLLYIAAGAFGMVGMFITQAQILEGYTIAGTVVAAAIFAGFWLEKRTRMRLETLNSASTQGNAKLEPHP